MPVERLEEWANRVLERAGLSGDDARVVAASLAYADSRGVVSHGMLRLGTYIRRIRSGGINPVAKVTVLADLGALVVLDADDGPGASTAWRAAELVIERAQEHGVACVSARNASHFGSAGFFVNHIADAGLVGLATCNTESVMCAPFGGRPVLGTNPFAFALPLPHDERPQVDMATTTASQGKLIAAAQRGEEIPLGWAVDRSGNATTSPAAGLEGALLPGGGHKGFGLAFAMDALLAVSGANVSPSVNALDGDPGVPQRLGHLFIAIRPDPVDSLDGYRSRIARLVDAIHASGIDADGPSPMVPGEPELNHERRAGGSVELSDPLLAELLSIGAEVGVPFPDITEVGAG